MIRTGAILASALALATTAHAENVAAPATPDDICSDPSDVLGERACPGYAAWSTEGPNAFAEVGAYARHLPGASRPVVDGAAREVTTPDASGRRTSDGALGISFVERLGFRLGPLIYVVGEAELGTGGAAIGGDDGDRVTLLGALGGVGARVPLGFGSIGVELGGGGRIAGALPDQFETDAEGVVELRGRGALWLSPWVSLDVTAGRSLITEGDWMVGISLSVETYAFGHDRARY